MTQLGEPVKVGIIQPKPIKNIFVALTSITFESGIKVFDVESGGAEKELPPAGSPHWTVKASYPAVYVRQGGTGETKTLKLKVEWLQKGYDGSAKLKGVSSDGKAVIEGDFTISGERGNAEVSCTFNKKPDTVANHGKGLGFNWTAVASGETVAVTGGSLLKLFFVDAKPKPIGWVSVRAPYKAHYLRVIEWATTWAQGKSGDAAVLKAIWGQFSDGKGARVPHATGFSYWKTGDPIQDLKKLIQPDGNAKMLGWSCKAIAHTFMECLALHGIICLEVIPQKPPGTELFLVKNWNVEPAPIPNWDTNPDLYYAGSWVDMPWGPLSKEVPTSLTRQAAGKATKIKLRVDMKKRAGVVAQGQLSAPLGFSNHWIVEVGGKLYDTSYGAVHTNDMSAYAKNSLAGWLIDVLSDSYSTGLPPLLTAHSAAAWRAHAIDKHKLLRDDASHN